MHTFIYSDNEQKPPKEVFRCQAETILHADENYAEVTGNDPSRQKFIGCQIVFAKTAQST